MFLPSLPILPPFCVCASEQVVVLLTEWMVWEVLLGVLFAIGWVPRRLGLLSERLLALVDFYVAIHSRYPHYS